VENDHKEGDGEQGDGEDGDGSDQEGAVEDPPSIPKEVRLPKEGAGGRKGRAKVEVVETIPANPRKVPFPIHETLEKLQVSNDVLE
jgi:hypothetical protein